MKTLRIYPLLLLALLATSAVQAQQSLPPFSFSGTQGKAITFNDMPRGKTLFVLYFSPDCDHCNAQAAAISQQIGLFDNAAFLWVNAFNEMDEIRAFEQKYFAGKQGQFFFAKDDDFLFDRYFGDSQVPSIYVYDAQGKRTASYAVDNSGHFDTIPASKLAGHIAQ